MPQYEGYAKYCASHHGSQAGDYCTPGSEKTAYDAKQFNITGGHTADGIKWQKHSEPGCESSDCREQPHHARINGV